MSSAKGVTWLGSLFVSSITWHTVSGKQMFAELINTIANVQQQSNFE